MGLCAAKTEEIAIFETESLKQLIEFKWSAYGRHLHLNSLMAICFYAIIQGLYVNQVYMQQSTDNFELYWYGLLLSTVYPLLYNVVKLWR